MRFVTFRQGQRVGLGLVDERRGVLDLGAAGLPASMQALVEAGPAVLQSAHVAADNAAAWLPLASVTLLAPIPLPRKNVFCVGRNYRQHIIEMSTAMGREPSFPKVPEFFSKPATTVVGPEAGVERHARNTGNLDYEVELGVVIGKRVRDIPAEAALAAVFGYTIINDVTARDAQRAHAQFFKGKSFDTFCPMGPWIVTADEFGDPAGHRLSLTVNGETRQDSNTSDLLFSVPQIIAALSASLTLEPGDIIATGTPSGVAAGMNPPKWLQVGDVVVCTIEGIGALRNRIIE